MMKTDWFIVENGFKNKNKSSFIWQLENKFVSLQHRTIKTDKIMSRIKMQVTLTFTADVDDDLSADDIMDRVDVSAIGDGEFVEVYDTEVENFNLIDSK